MRVNLIKKVNENLNNHGTTKEVRIVTPIVFSMDDHNYGTYDLSERMPLSWVPESYIVFQEVKELVNGPDSELAEDFNRFVGPGNVFNPSVDRVGDNLLLTMKVTTSVGTDVNELVNEILGQYSDGIGEGLEQRELVEVGVYVDYDEDGEEVDEEIPASVYMHLWNRSLNYTVEVSVK